MSDDLTKDQLVSDSITTNTVQQPENPIGNPNKELQSPSSAEMEAKITAVEHGVEVSQELQAQGVQATGHDRVSVRLDDKLKPEPEKPINETTSGSTEPPFKLLMPQEEALSAEKSGNKGSSLFGAALAQIRQVVRWRTNSRTPVQKPA